MDCLWKWMKRGVETVNRNDRLVFITSVRFAQWLHWSHHDRDKLGALGTSMKWLREHFPDGVDDMVREVD
eukprot:2664410-Amphidinium_carterae.1